MITYMQILLGLVIGCTGFFQIATSPLPACGALLISGFLILAGIDHLNHLSKQTIHTEAEGGDGYES